MSQYVANNQDTARQRRIDHPDWMSMLTIRCTGGQHESLLAAAGLANRSFNGWALETLLRAAETEKAKYGS